jgi:hypothetical protein
MSMPDPGTQEIDRAAAVVGNSNWACMRLVEIREATLRAVGAHAKNSGAHQGLDALNDPEFKLA